jgi:hypothetical protein
LGEHAFVPSKKQRAWLVDSGHAGTRGPMNLIVRCSSYHVPR